MDLILTWVLQFKYFGIFGLLALGVIGLPIPDETTLVFLGFLVFRRNLELVPTLLAAFLGSAAGMTVSYLLGRTFGLYLLHRYGPRFGATAERVDRVHAWFAQVGKWTLTLGYFVPGIRHLSAFVAGSSKLEYPLFALFAYPGALAWTAVFIFLGNYLGENWKRLADQFGIQAALGAVVLVLAAGVFLLLRRRRGR
jgi:membrane protein DedA with SNARE-associated domain